MKTTQTFSNYFKSWMSFPLRDLFCWHQITPWNLSNPVCEITTWSWKKNSFCWIANWLSWTSFLPPAVSSNWNPKLRHWRGPMTQQLGKKTWIEMEMVKITSNQYLLLQHTFTWSGRVREKTDIKMEEFKCHQIDFIFASLLKQISS